MIRTFKHGGIHPADNKISADSAIETIAPEGIVQIFLSQHIGAPSTPVVAKGDRLKVGQLIAKSTGFVSANIHSSVSGTVTNIDLVADHIGVKKEAVVIKVEGDEWLEDIDRSGSIVKEIKLSAEEILKKIAASGMVGLGGAAFPSHVKLSVPPGKKAEYLIINAAECEPYLTSDYRVMLEHTEELMIGVQILKKAVGVTVAYIGVEINKPKAIEKLNVLTSEYEGIRIVPLKKKYPQGGEKQLIKAVTNREVPSGCLPVDVGAIVHNVGTAFSVYEAVQKNKPLIDNIVTVTGKSMSVQRNLLVRVGTPVSKLLEIAGGMPENTGKVIFGGPMMGKAASNPDAPTQKSTSAILLMPDMESHRGKTSACIRCSRCVSVCPMNLEPYLLKRLAECKMFEESEKNSAHDCIECGSCAYSCPASIPLLDYIRLGKTEVLKMKRNRTTS
ncbi:MAG: electron transport complex subunit RsxC [Prevotellaceae bacterium]|jgi:electron transport complex protein RnfC|nr:electron transport complex subunit RsxC [Prevotellaceae bacterium]